MLNASETAISQVHPGISSPLLAEARTALETLRRDLNTTEGWSKVHVAEALISSGDAAFVRAAFLKEKEEHWADNQRIGLWRVLAAISTDGNREHWIRCIEERFLKPGDPDRVVALESLCKLGRVPSGRLLTAIQKSKRTLPEEDALYALWALQLAKEPGILPALARALESPIPLSRLRAAAILAKLKPSDPSILQQVALAVHRESADSIAYPYLLKAVVLLNGDPKHSGLWISQLKQMLLNGPLETRLQTAEVLVGRLTEEELSNYAKLMNDTNPQVRTAIAWLILSSRR